MDVHIFLERAEPVMSPTFLTIQKGVYRSKKTVMHIQKSPQWQNVNCYALSSWLVLELVNQMRD